MSSRKTTWQIKAVPTQTTISSIDLSKLVQTRPNLSITTMTLSQRWGRQMALILERSHHHRQQVLTCPNSSRLVQTCPNSSKLVQTCPNLSKLVQTCPNLSKLVQTRPNLSKLVQTRPNSSKLVSLDLTFSFSLTTKIFFPLFSIFLICCLVLTTNGI